MRIFLFAMSLLLAGCAATREIAPREYLDEQTANTITIVAEPWIFSRQDSPTQRDFVKLYALDVNRMGEHKRYLVALQYWPAGEIPPTLELRAPRSELTLAPLDADPRQLGFSAPLDATAPRSAKPWVYVLDKANLDWIAGTTELFIILVAGTSDSRAQYNVWRDGSAELSKFATTQAW